MKIKLNLLGFFAAALLIGAGIFGLHGKAHAATTIYMCSVQGSGVATYASSNSACASSSSTPSATYITNSGPASTTMQWSFCNNPSSTTTLPSASSCTFDPPSSNTEITYTPASATNWVKPENVSSCTDTGKDFVGSYTSPSYSGGLAGNNSQTDTVYWCAGINLASLAPSTTPYMVTIGVWGYQGATSSPFNPITINLNVTSPVLPACTATLTANPNPVAYNNPTILTWTTTNATKAVLTGGEFVKGLSVTPVAGGSIQTVNLTAPTTTYTLTASDPSGNSCSPPTPVSVTVNVNPLPACTATLTANPNPVAYNNPTILTWTTTNATKAVLTGGEFVKGLSVTPVAGGSIQTVNLTAPTTTYTLTASDPSGNSCSSQAVATVPVNVTQPCTIYVNSTVDGVSGTPKGGFSYTITGPSTPLEGNGPQSFSVNPDSTYTWTPTDPPTYNSSDITYDNLTPVPSALCSTPGGLITFTYNFSSSQPNPNCTTGNCPGGTVTLTVAPGACSGNETLTPIILSWTAATGTVNGYYIYSSPDKIFADATKIATVPNTPTTYPINNPSASPTYYWVQAYNTYGSGSLSNPIVSVAKSCQSVNFSNSNKEIYQVNSTGYYYGGNTYCGDSNGTEPTNLQLGDKITFYLNICNAPTATLSANSLDVYDWMTNLTPLSYAYSLNGGSSFSPITPTSTDCPSGVTAPICREFKASGLNITPNSRVVLEMIAAVSAPSGGSSQQNLRFNNEYEFSFGTSQTTNQNEGCYGTGDTGSTYCGPFTIGNYAFSNTSSGGSQQETNP